MDIICKCGHNGLNHSEFGCSFCDCKNPTANVLYIFITEQQARLDTNRAQVEALIAERDALKATLKKQQQILHNVELNRHWIGAMKECRVCIDILKGDV